MNLISILKRSNDKNPKEFRIIPNNEVKPLQISLIIESFNNQDRKILDKKAINEKYL